MKLFSDEELKSVIELDMLLDDFVLEKKSNYLKKLFEFPSGEWIEIKYFFDPDYYASNYQNSHIFVCWLPDTNGDYENYRIIIFFDTNDLVSQVISFNMKTL
ncbi:hypothetical protein [Neisseria sicca]|jgi:hypothetical protein|uniref:hypothetical protein n=1 Tax=Neisseria sicca TaxID=490 RepID=UPI000D3030F2|nr:hypothetical protein [Neisseria sicca]